MEQARIALLGIPLIRQMDKHVENKICFQQNPRRFHYFYIGLLLVVLAAQLLKMKEDLTIERILQCIISIIIIDILRNGRFR